MDRLLSHLMENNDFVIATHFPYDGDGVGSAVGLMLGLSSIGKSASFFCFDLPYKYSFLLKDIDITNTFDGKNLILVDCSSINRIGINASDLYKSLAIIDHHLNTSDISDGITWISPYPATSMQIYYLLKALGVTITKKIATALYVGITYDTSSFKHSTTPDVFTVVSELLKTGIDTTQIHRSLFEEWTWSKFDVFKRYLNILEVTDGVAIACIGKDIAEQTGAKEDEIRSCVGFALSVKDIHTSVLLYEWGEKTKVEFRSKILDVGKIAKQLGGGGHKFASGCTLDMDLNSAKILIMKILKEK